MPVVTAKDFGNPQAAGEYQIGNAYYQVDRRHIAAWAENPELTFRTIVCTSVRDRRERYALGAPFEARR